MVMRRLSAASLALVRFLKKTEAAMTPDLSKANGRHAPGGCRQRRLGVEVLLS